MTEFDTERFIIEIQLRPVLWDSKSDEYNNKILKKKSWQELCLLFIPDFENKSGSEKNAAATDLQKRWKSIRDSYSRELKKKKLDKSGAAAESRREYVHFKQLQFLLDLHTTKRKQDETTETANSSTSITPSASAPSTSSIKRRKVNDTDNDGTAVMTLIADKIQNINNRPVPDSDMHFLLSLYEDFHKIPTEKKIDAKMELMGIVKKFTNTMYNNYQYGYYTQNQQLNTFSENRYESPSSAQSNYSRVMTDELDIDTHLFDDSPEL